MVLQTLSNREIKITYEPLSSWVKFRYWLLNRDTDCDQNEYGRWFGKSWTVLGVTLSIVWW